ncbi:MAG TPA: hypothetical protein VJZ27_16090, partial [Aggregatilineales bacterium]|nr:hypothetical protein [Aggregatilineales bacterium]
LGVIALFAAFLGAFLVASGALPAQYNLKPGEIVPDVYAPDNYEITVLIDELAAPRGIAAHSEENVIFVSERGAGRILALQDSDNDRIADEPVVVIDELRAPSGLAYYEGWLYVADTDEVLRLQLDEDFRAANREVIIKGLPIGANQSEVESNQHALTIHDGELYVSIDASCAACRETDSRRATVMVYDLDGSNERVFARGLYRVLGLATNPVTNALWASNQGRPQTEDPAPETLYQIENGDDAGWTRCIAGTIIDPDMGSEGGCDNVLQPLTTFEAQSNIASILFLDNPNVPEAYRGDLLVALHGGVIEKGRNGEQYGFIVLHLDIAPETGQITSEPEPFVDGFWLSPEPGDFLGRPFGLAMTPDGILYI